MKHRFACGFDHGNAETGVVILDSFQNEELRTTMPSAIYSGARATLENLATTRSGRDGKGFYRWSDALDQGEYVLKLGGTEYFVGELAVQESRDEVTARDDVTRYWSERALIMLLAATAETLPYDEYELYVVTGLPVATFSAENADRVKKALDDPCDFTFNGRPRRAIIHPVRVVMEAAGSMIAYGSDKHTRQGVIDIGGRTTDLYAAQGQRPLLNLCRGKEYGVESVCDEINSRFFSIYGYDLPIVDRHALLQAALTRRYPTLSFQATVISEAVLQEWVEASIEHVAGEIMSFVSKTWRTSERGLVAADIAPVLLIGGGAHFFYEHIRERIPHVTRPPYPELANAKGYAALAEAIMEQEEARQKRAAS